MVGSIHLDTVASRVPIAVANASPATTSKPPVNPADESAMRPMTNGPLTPPTSPTANQMPLARPALDGVTRSASIKMRMVRGTSAERAAETIVPITMSGGEPNAVMQRPHANRMNAAISKPTTRRGLAKLGITAEIPIPTRPARAVQFAATDGEKPPRSSTTVTVHDPRA